jgi:hypothetical protein
MTPQNTFESNGVKLDDYLRILDVASALRKQGELVNQQLNLDEQKAKLRDHLLKTAESTGEKLSEEQINAAIGTYFQNLYSFKEPKKDIRYKLAELYVDRKKIARTVGVPVVIVSTAGVLGFGAVSIGKTVYETAQEKRIESEIENIYQVDQALKIKISSISSSNVLNQLPDSERRDVKSIITNSDSIINNKVKLFLDKYCPSGEADNKVNRENYREVEKQISPIKGAIASVNSDLDKTKAIIQTQVRLSDLKNDLETLVGEIRNEGSIEQFNDRAEVAYKNGMVCINNRQIPCAEENKNKLVSIQTDIHDYGTLISRADQVYSDIKAVAKEDVAKEKGEELYAKVKESVKAVDVPKLRKTTQGLESLDTILNEEYELKIVSRPDVKSGIDRYYNAPNGEKIFSGWYLIVEAVNDNGQKLFVNITDCEDGITKKVDMWGEKVTEKDPDVLRKVKEGIYNDNSLLQRVVKDKLEDGIVDNNRIGKKRKGYISYTYNNRDLLGKQIIREGKDMEGKDANKW